MCRYGDDFDWWLTDEGIVVHDAERRCEDCKRTIEPGEPHVEMTGEADPEGDNASWIFMAIDPGPSGRNWHTAGNPWFGIDEDDADLFEALGFRVIEEVDPTHDRGVSYHYCCQQCRVGNEWLETICGQQHILVTHTDLIEHADDYSLDDIGADLKALGQLARNEWRHFWGARATPETVKILSERAIAYARTTGFDAHDY